MMMMINWRGFEASRFFSLRAATLGSLFLWRGAPYCLGLKSPPAKNLLSPANTVPEGRLGVHQNLKLDDYEERTFSPQPTTLSQKEGWGVHQKV